MTNSLTNFCPLPFGHVRVSPTGDYQVCCCHFTPSEHKTVITDTDHVTWLSSKYVNEVKTSFLENKKHPGCNKCWHDESLGIPSYRQRVLTEYQILGVDCNSSAAVNVELCIGNLCNLTCVMCNETSSSAILAENRRIGISQTNQQDFQWADQADENLQKLINADIRVLNIRGGEPFYNKTLLKLLQNIPESQCRRMLVHITTNATVWNDGWQQTLKRFKLVRIMFSIDAVENVYEYIRYPASWSVVQRNVELMLDQPNFKCMVNCVVQNLNIANLSKLLTWCQKYNLYIDLSLLSNWDYLRPENLPPMAKQAALDDINKCLQLSTEDRLLTVLKSYRNILTDAPDDPANWEVFKSKMAMRESLRGNSYQTVIPGT